MPERDGPNFYDGPIPDGLTFADLREAAKLVWNWDADDEPSGGEPRDAYELVASVFESLRAAAARNSGNL